MTRLKRPKPETIYQLKITLAGLRPPVWRRVLVPADVTLEELHYVIQRSMGWGNDHLHCFEVGGVQYGQPDRELDMNDEGRARLDKIAPTEGSKFTYEYDFGDSWRHTVVVEKILPADAEQHYPVCIKGKRACPPEDCGGVWGYVNLLEILADPEHPEYKAMKEWTGQELDPEAFDLDLVNQRLSRLW